MRNAFATGCLGLLAVFLPLAAGEETTFRIRLGLTDTAPTTWDGQVAVSGGRVAELRSWRPREADEVDSASWKLATSEGRKFRWRNWEPEYPYPVEDFLYHVGLWLTVDSEGDARVDIETAQGNFSFHTAATGVGEPREFLDGAVSVERAGDYGSVSQDEYESSGAAIVTEPNGAYWVAWIGYQGWANRAFARRFDGAAWGATHELSEGENDIYGIELARDGDGGVVAVWSNRADENFDLYAQRFDGTRWSSISRLTSEGGSDIHHALETDSDGRVWLVWQGVRDEKHEILTRRWDGSSWSPEQKVSAGEADNWNPAIAADSKGNVYVAWDTYENNDYDIVMRRFDGESWGGVEPVADTLRYEAYPSLVCDSEDRLWAAWNESGMRWGKDTGFLVRRPATSLYESRWISTAVHDGSRWVTAKAEFEKSLPAELQGFNDFPRLETTADGRVWLAFRHRLLRQGYVPKMAASHRAAWETFATAFDGKSWSTPTPLAVTQGRSDHRLSLADGGDRLIAAWATDNRIYDEYFFEHGEIFAGAVPAIAGPTYEARLEPKVREEMTIYPAHPNEEEDVATIRDYEIRSEGKTYKIYRGDTHRHTEYSGDGNNDGSLNDTYRYAINAASLDYLGVSDHHNSGGPNIEYINWLLQQRVDVFHIPGRFVSLFGYERGESYPNGHRNIFFAERGNPTLPTQPNERETSSGQVGLFDYVRKYNGISIPHTPATGMGTDWRDSAPDVEPLVEIFQGDRVSAEYDGAPFAASEEVIKLQAGGYREKGYLWNAWAKGIKIGLQASSDHLSTHFSFACTIAEDFTREGLIDAMKKRHNYAATDNIVLDYRLRTDGREYLQGDALESQSGEFEIRVKVLGTAPIRQIDVIRNQEFVHTLQNLGKNAEFTFVDKDAPAGESYYYVRVQQANEQLAWSSPIWIVLPR